jgi:hypothetical protein
MDIRNVELTVEDILSIHRHWVTKLYVEDNKTEAEIVSLLHECRLPVTYGLPRAYCSFTCLLLYSISQIQSCLSEWGLIASASSSRRYSSASSLGSDSTEDDWDAIRCPSPASSTSSTSSYYSTSPENVELYSRRPLPSLPSSRGIPTPTQSKSLRLRRTTRPVDSVDAYSTRRFAAHSFSLLTKGTSHQTKPRSYEVETTLSKFQKGPSPLDIFANDIQSHERIAVGLRRVKVEYSENASVHNGDEFEWMRQFKEYKSFNTERREVKILHDEYDGDEE